MQRPNEKCAGFAGVLYAMFPTRNRLTVTAMKQILSFSAAVLTLLLATSANAASCEDAIDSVQQQVDTAIDKRAGGGPWRPESLSALRSYQPTPRSIANAEGAGSASLTRALKALKRARAASNGGKTALCFAEVNRARRQLAPF
jgi:hypothetical protein